MALDAATLALCAKELDKELADSKIEKIYQPTRDEVLLLMRSRHASARLLLCARSGSARLCLTGESYENPQTPPSFCMLLRKHLTGGRLVSIHAEAGERIVYFVFLCTNEMGDLVYNTLCAELMGRYCNLVLVTSGGAQNPPVAGDKILDALKRVDYEDSDIRQLLPGLSYTLPPRPAGLDFLTSPVEDILARMAALDAPASAALRKTAGGVGPVIAREACYRALGPEDPPANRLDAAQKAALAEAINTLREQHQKGGTPTLVRKPDGAPVEFSFTALTQYAPAFALETYPGYSALLEGYYAEKDRADRLRNKSKSLRKTVQNLLDRAVRKQAARLEDKEKSEKSEHLRIEGELLTANLHAIQKGDKEVTLLNWYDGQQVTIGLDVRLSPGANAQKRFKEYKKRQTAAKMLEDLLRQGAREVAYLQTVLYEVDGAAGEAALGDIRAELKEQGYLKYYKKRDKRQKPADFLRYRSADGFLILVGRNNLQNDRLTLKTARGKDMWFHTKNAPGSHVVVMSEGRDVPPATQNQAALLAVWHSSQRGSAQVPVDYTEVKNIRKTGDLPPGMVLYERYETAYVTVSPAEIEAIPQEAPRHENI